MENDVSPDEQITVYLVHSSDYIPSKGRPRYAAYMPAKDKMKSVFRTTSLSHDEVRSIGSAVVEPKRGRLKGYANQTAGIMFAQSLTIVPDIIPHERHANIAGWTGYPAADRIRAIKIAETATLALYEPEDSAI